MTLSPSSSPAQPAEATEPAVLNVAMVGHNFMGRAHGNAYRQANHFFALPMQVVPYVVVGRDLERAATAAQQLGFQYATTELEAVLADPDVHVVDVATPNDSHYPIAMAALRARKHVLCEKPLAMNLAEACAMFDAARAHGTMLLEAYPWWFQPQTAAMLGLLHGGAIGRVRAVQVSFGFTLHDPAGLNIRLQPALGGALMDAGCYGLSLVRLVMGRAARRVRAESRLGPTGVDLATTATLHFDDGAVAQVGCAMDMAQHRQATIVGSDGVITTEYLNHTAAPGESHPWGYQPSLLRVRRGSGPGPFETVQSPAGSGFRFAAEAFAAVVAARDAGAIERAAAASLDIAAMLDAIAASAREGGREVNLG